jgi:hypothetical protein
VDQLLDGFRRAFVARIEGARTELRGGVGEDLLLAAVVEALGLERGTAILAATPPESPRAAAIASFLSRLRDEGLTTRRTHFAIQRYHRWLEVNPAATVEARGRMLDELWSTYALAREVQAWPDTRLRFFRRTAFRGARPRLAEALDRLVRSARTAQGALELDEQLAALRGAVAPSAEEDWFLARMTYPWLAPSDDASLITIPAGGQYVAEVVQAFTDAEEHRFTVRGPTSPREVSALLHLFQDASLAVTFTAEHDVLLCLDASEIPVGGLFYRRLGPERIHMEKLVVTRRYRGSGIADGLVRELFRRMQARGVRRVETGWFQPETFSRFGFRTDPSSGGLVRELSPELWPAT